MSNLNVGKNYLLENLMLDYPMKSLTAKRRRERDERCIKEAKLDNGTGTWVVECMHYVILYII